MLDAGDRACAMEVSSHALELGRAAGIHFACRVFTNLSQDHLDFHPTMEEYFLAKRRLFDEPGPRDRQPRRRARRGGWRPSATASASPSSATPTTAPATSSST